MCLATSTSPPSSKDTPTPCSGNLHQSRENENVTSSSSSSSSPHLQRVRQELATLAHDDAAYADTDLHAFWLMHSNSSSDAESAKTTAKAVVAAAEWKQANPVRMADISAFYRAPPGCRHPPGCMVVLEDMKGDVARDAKGRPIVVVVGGFLHGTGEEMVMQTHYAMQRLALYARPGQAAHECCVVLETQPRGRGESVAFRFPGDAASRRVFDVMKRYFPGTQLSVAHFCGLPRIIAASFNMCRPFLSSHVFDRLQLKPNFGHLKRDGHITPDNLLPLWDSAGTFQFDLDAYVEWRAKEEGADPSQICPRGLGRQYVQDDSVVSSQDLLGNVDTMKQCKVIKYGAVQKQGSGLGLFGSRRWKSKLLVVIPTVLFYFDAQDISSTNKATRVIALDPSCTVQMVPDAGNGDVKAVLRIHAMGRGFDFGFHSQEEATEWQMSIQEAFHARA